MLDQNKPLGDGVKRGIGNALSKAKQSMPEQKKKNPHQQGAGVNALIPNNSQPEVVAQARVPTAEKKERTYSLLDVLGGVILAALFLWFIYAGNAREKAMEGLPQSSSIKATIIK